MIFSNAHAHSIDAPATRPLPVTSRNKKMPKFNKISCCARGGAWFDNCVDVGEAHSNHKWFEGSQACKGLATSVAVRSQRQMMLHRNTVVDYPLHTAQSRNDNRQQSNIDVTGRIASAGATHFTGYGLILMPYLRMLLSSILLYETTYWCLMFMLMI